MESWMLDIRDVSESWTLNMAAYLASLPSSGRRVWWVWSVYNMSVWSYTSSQPRPHLHHATYGQYPHISSPVTLTNLTPVHPPHPLSSCLLPRRGRPGPHRDGGQPCTDRPRPGQACRSQGWVTECKERLYIFVLQATSTPTSSTTTADLWRSTDTELFWCRFTNKD